MELIVQIEETGGWRVVTKAGESVGYINPVHDGVHVNGLHAGVLDGMAPGPYPSLAEAIRAIGLYAGASCVLAA